MYIWYFWCFIDVCDVLLIWDCLLILATAAVTAELVLIVFNSWFYLFHFSRRIKTLQKLLVKESGAHLSQSVSPVWRRQEPLRNGTKFTSSFFWTLQTPRSGSLTDHLPGGPGCLLDPRGPPSVSIHQRDITWPLNQEVQIPHWKNTTVLVEVHLVQVGCVCVVRNVYFGYWR